MLQEMVTLGTRHGSAMRQPTAIDRLAIFTAPCPTAPLPALFEQEFYVLLQGGKTMTIGNDCFRCQPRTCAVASVGMPFISQVVEATEEKPYVGVALALDASLIGSLLFDMPDDAASPSGAISIADVDDAMMEPLLRLLRLLDAPAEIPVLAPQFERELTFRLLQGPLAPRLRQIGRHNARFAQIKKAAEWIAQNAQKSMRIDWLAAHVGMSITSFHRHFKSITAYTPLAYQRHIRLMEARRLLIDGSLNVTSAAYASGYASASQFSREYKRAFGSPPVTAVAMAP